MSNNKLISEIFNQAEVQSPFYRSQFFAQQPSDIDYFNQNKENSPFIQIKE